MKNTITRREALLGSLISGSYLGLRAMATGLPAWYLADPRRATAQDLECTIAAKEKLQYLIVSASSMGDPINCNCPGTYEAPEIIHPMQPEMAATPLMLGGKMYQVAKPWATVEAGGALQAATHGRMLFFHHSTRTTVHGDQPKVMKLLGATNRGEMLVSAYAKHLATCFGTVQREPIAVGARGNASELVSFAGRTLPAVSPTQLKQLLTGSRTDPLVKLRPLRDAALDRLNELAKSEGSPVQKAFLDSLALSQRQVRALAEQLATTLMAITADDVNGQALAAAALISANVTPVVTIRIPFGGDNHSDQDLQTEVTQTVSGVQGIQAVQNALGMLNLTDKVTFATLNVFGRNLNGIAKVESRSGRDHYGNHSVMLMIGKNVKAGVIGGVAKGGSSGAYVASDIDSTSGAAAMGGDIKAAETHVSAARTLGAALGIPDDMAAEDYVASAGGKVVRMGLI
ncbi:MAG TPA: DUF1501 domain-containing protein [Polyangiales bacterium]|nr:DUF1501 domain-containing protein [Polyangiales bacterium]